MQVRDIRLLEKSEASAPLGAPAKDEQGTLQGPVKASAAPQLSSRASLGNPQFVVSILHDPTTGHLLIKVRPTP
jgi:hypothetical protein